MRDIDQITAYIKSVNGNTSHMPGFRQFLIELFKEYPTRSDAQWSYSEIADSVYRKLRELKICARSQRYKAACITGFVCAQLGILLLRGSFLREPLLLKRHRYYNTYLYAEMRYTLFQVAQRARKRKGS